MGIFSIQRTEDNKASISLEDRLDREIASHYLLTVKCFRKDSRPTQLENKPYNRLVSIFVDTKLLNRKCRHPFIYRTHESNIERSNKFRTRPILNK